MTNPLDKGVGTKFEPGTDRVKKSIYSSIEK